MTHLTYQDIAHRLQQPLDCSKISDLRGLYFHNRLILNHENADLSGCLLLHCFPFGIPRAVEVNPAQSEKEVTLRGADLRKARLSGMVHPFADFSHANLANSEFIQAKLKRANFENACLMFTDFYEADLAGADLADADFSKTHSPDVNLDGVCGLRTNFESALLVDASLATAYLRYANFRDADLRYADLRDADLRDADLGQADLEGAKLNGANLEGAYYDSRTNLEGSDITASQRRGMRFRSVGDRPYHPALPKSRLWS